MKIARQHSEASFFVTFCDLLFALMAIFVFLMVIVATQVSAPQAPSPEDNRNDLTQAQKIIQEQKNQLEALKVSTTKREKEIADAVATEPIDLVFLLDGTASMEPSIAALRTAITEIVAEVPNVTSRLRIGMIVYRRELEISPMRVIFPKQLDSGASIKMLQDVLYKIQAHSDPADIGGAIHEGLKLLGGNGDKQRMSLILVGDVGPYEMRNFGGRNSEAIQEEGQLAREVRTFASSHRKFSVLTVLPPIASNSASLVHEVETAAFFHRLVASADEGKGHYNRDISAMLSHILLSILSTNAKN